MYSVWHLKHLTCACQTGTHPQLLALGILVGDVTGPRVHLVAELRVTMQDPTPVQLLFWSLCHCDMSSLWLGGCTFIGRSGFRQ